MSRSPPRCIHLMLILLQFLAPWVHAHTGGETLEFFHVPGLERLASAAVETPGGASASAIDVIVGIPAGIEYAGHNGCGAPDDGGPAFPPPYPPDLPLINSTQVSGPGVNGSPLIPARRMLRPGAPPRASPAVSARVSRA